MSRANNNLLNIQPTDHELKFPFELNKKTSSSLQFTNNTDGYVAFKVKTTNPKKYSASPNMGIVLPGTTCDVTVAMQAQKEAPQDMLQSKDKFLVQTTVVAAPTRNITSEIFSKESGRVIEEFKLRVIYVVPVANPVQQGSDQGSSSTPSLASCVDNGSQTTCCIKTSNNLLNMQCEIGKSFQKIFVSKIDGSLSNGEKLVRGSPKATCNQIFLEEDAFETLAKSKFIIKSQ
ncbi:vesicle-associated protein 3-1-like [Papaver somniferum]|uniref:vesicle-associated protein 3-1-like n=1 Tax=Papaver somniferum TaxID=3469 RepID=UPI000E702A02|nr:vesicle-associated protein 3-1-like [Papaver somniferum]